METPVSNLPEFSVSELSQAVKRTIEGTFERVRVRGEISRPSFPASGHVYFRLKDENAVLDAVCWRGLATKLSIRPEDGLEVIATGRLTTYAGRSTYQIVVESLEVAGEGALLKLLEERRKKLAAEGLFDEDRKRALPYLPEVIGVVTSPSGAVIRDILHRLAERFPRHVLVWPVPVQGEEAAGAVAAAIAGFNALSKDGAVPRPDVLIIARGGGSLEDLWAFNEEEVVRAAAASQIPLISAVGHETDTTLIDFASDKRAPTPTAAAEMAVPVRAELEAHVMDMARRLHGAGNRGLQQRRREIEGLARGLTHPARLLEEKTQRLDELSGRATRAAQTLIQQRQAEVRHLAAQIPHPKQQIRFTHNELTGWADRLVKAGPRLLKERRESFERIDAARRLQRGWGEARRRADEEIEALGRLLGSYSYESVLGRGFALIHGESGVLTRAEQVAAGDNLAIEFQDGRVRAIAEGGDGGEGRKKAKPAAKPRKTAPPASQGDLF